MSWSYEDVREELLCTLSNLDPVSDTEDYTACLSKLENLNRAESGQFREEPTEAPETGVKAWFERHSDALIRVGGTLSAIVMIGIAEQKFDMIFRSKASKFI